MQFIETELKSVYIIQLEQVEDERGFFARSWCKKELQNLGIDDDIVQCNISFNKKKGTLRGMHYQAKPYGEAKVVRCTRGSIYDVVIDLREESQTFLKWTSIELNENNRESLYIPKGCAHGFQTLEDNTEIFYQMSEFYYSKYARGIRWDDSTFNVKWPIKDKIISDRDNSFEKYVFNGGVQNGK